MDEFFIPFGDGLEANNRWVKIARTIPWDLIEEEYANIFSEESGRPPVPSARQGCGSFAASLS